MVNKERSDPRSLVRSLEGLRCWYVSCESVGSTFELAFGEKVARPVILKNPAHTEEYRHYEGEANLLVWCTWRLDGPEGPLTSWDDVRETIGRILGRLKGAKVRRVSLTDKTWDLRVRFGNRLKLTLFCDPSFEGNWELWLRNLALLIGPGSHWEIEERTDLSAASLPNEKKSAATDYRPAEK